jgi:dolichol kinase
MLTKAEINRKMLHLLALLMPAGIFYGPKIMGFAKWTAPLILACLFLLSTLLERLRFAFPAVQNAYRICFHLLMRTNEDNKTTGATYIIGGAMICSVVFVDSPDISFMVLVLFILGDAAAALVGLSIGRVRILGKSLEGSAACLGLCLMLFAVLFPNIPLLLDHWQGKVSFPLMVITSLAITVLELIPVKITRSFTLNDNLYVPVCTGLILKYVEPFL